MKCIKTPIIFILLLTFISCGFQTKQSVIGTYVFNKTDFVKDTLKIFPDGSYEKRTYKAANDSLIYINKNKWEYEYPNIITLHDFLPNEHSEFNNPKEVLDKVLITSGLQIVDRYGTICIEESEGYEDYFLKLNN